jgi:hypothetical protein
VNASSRNSTNGLFTSALNQTTTPFDTCMLPSYFNHFAILILIATTIVTQLSHLTKILLMVVITGEFNECAIIYRSRCHCRYSIMLIARETGFDLFNIEL